jgi:adenylate cyclase
MPHSDLALPTVPGAAPHPHFFRQLRLFLEEICSEICRFRHVEHDGVPPDAVQVSREVDLGIPGAFADIVVEPTGLAPYFVEVKYSYATDRMVQHLVRKYGTRAPSVPGANKLVLVVDAASRTDWPEQEARLRRGLRPDLALEVWDEKRLCSLIHECFKIDLKAITIDSLRDVRGAIDDAKWAHAFGDQWTGSSYQSPLLWHFGFWRLRQLHQKYGLTPEQILPPGRYRGVVILLADLSSFSSFVRDTRDDEVVRSALTTYYSNSRYAVMNAGGMMCQFVGDEVVALFGVPLSDEGYASRALDCARALVQIGSSVSNKWQREIDRVQASGGVHIGMAMGDVEVVPLRPFCRTHMGVIGDAINMAARLMACAGSSQVVASNTYFQMLPEAERAHFEETEPVEGRNVGLIKSWRLTLPSSFSPTGA